MTTPAIAEKPGAEGGEPDDSGSEPQGKTAEEQLDDLDIGENAEPVEVGGEEPTIEEVDLTEDDVAGTTNGLFDGDEGAEKSTADGGGDPEGEADETKDPLGLEGDETGDMDGLASAINEGAARLAVTGLEGDEKEDLETEFTETFEAFKLGHFASQAADEYVFSGDDDIDPLWGLLGTAMLCAAFALWTRPDTEEQMDRMKGAVSGLADGVPS